MERGFTQGHVRAIPQNAEESRTLEFVISTRARDRYSTVLNPHGWDLESFNRNGIVGYQHNVYGDACNPPNPDDVIGTGRAWLEGDELIGSVRFEPADLNPLAEKVFRKVLHGTLKGASVGFIPQGKGHFGEGDEARGGPRETYYFEGQELLEFSIVNIPANPQALARGLRDQTAHALMFLRRATGLSFAEIERLTIGEAIRRLDRNAIATSDDDTPLAALEVEPTPEPTTLTVADAATALRQAIRDSLTSPLPRTAVEGKEVTA